MKLSPAEYAYFRFLFAQTGERYRHPSPHSRARHRRDHIRRLRILGVITQVTPCNAK